MSDVPKGYKQTEVGVIPEDWEVETIGAIGQVGRGRVISHREIAKSFNPHYPVFSSQTSNNGVMGYLDTYDFEGEYVTWTTDGANAGTVFHRNGRFNCTNVCGTIELNGNDAEFVTRVLSKQAPRHVSRQLGNPKLMNDVMKRVSIPLPPLPEQRAIASALADVDTLLASLEELLTKKRQLKQAAMQELLTGRTRLEGFEGAWEEVRLGDIATFLNNGTNSRAELTYEGKVKYLHYGDIHKSDSAFFNVSGNDVPYVPTEKAIQLDRLKDGDLVFADASEDTEGVGKSVEICNLLGQELVSGLHTIALRLDDKKIVKGFAGYLQFYPNFKHHLYSLAAGTKVLAINSKFIASAVLALPPLPEQQAIASILSDMDAEIDALDERLGKTRSLKQGMMQELLTGRTRLI